MTGYVFTFGVDGFGADVAPAYEEGFYRDYNQALKHQIELNKKIIQKNGDYWCYQEAKGNIKRLCKMIDGEEPPIGLYGLVEIKVH